MSTTDQKTYALSHMLLVTDTGEAGQRAKRDDQTDKGQERGNSQIQKRQEKERQREREREIERTRECRMTLNFQR